MSFPDKDRLLRVRAGMLHNRLHLYRLVVTQKTVIVDESPHKWRSSPSVENAMRVVDVYGTSLVCKCKEVAVGLRLSQSKSFAGIEDNQRSIIIFEMVREQAFDQFEAKIRIAFHRGLKGTPQSLSVYFFVKADNVSYSIANLLFQFKKYGAAEYIFTLCGTSCI